MCALLEGGEEEVETWELGGGGGGVITAGQHRGIALPAYHRYLGRYS